MLGAGAGGERGGEARAHGAHPQLEGPFGVFVNSV